MFCPRCGVEYAPGVSACEECGVPLVEERPARVPGPESDEPDWECVLESFNQGDVAVARSLRDGAGITHFTEADAFGRVRPFVVPVRILVRPVEAVRAREVLADLELAYGTINLEKGTAPHLARSRAAAPGGGGRFGRRVVCRPAEPARDVRRSPRHKRRNLRRSPELLCACRQPVPERRNGLAWRLRKSM